MVGSPEQWSPLLEMPPKNGRMNEISRGFPQGFGRDGKIIW